MGFAARRSFVFSQDYTVRAVIDCGRIKQFCSAALCFRHKSLLVAATERASCLNQSCFGRLGLIK